MLGEYTVSVSKPAAITGTDITKLSPEEAKKRAAEMTDPAKSNYGKDGQLDPKSTPPSGEVPQKYADSTTSGLKASVKAGDANDFKYELPD
jgi:hypothetical protein